MLCPSFRTRLSAFSLIELLVSIGIIGVLIALVVPALYGVRGQALQTITRANLRQSLIAFGAYTDAYDETYPWRPQGGPIIPLNPERTTGIGPGHFDVSRYWPGFMHDVMPWEEHYQSWLGGGAKHGERPWTRDDGDPLSYRLSSFFLSHTFLARPKLWTPGATDTEQNLRPVREQDVLAPASKVLLFDWEKAHFRNDPDADRDVTLMLFVDGHVDDKRLSEASVLTDNPWRPPTPLHDTPNGVRGRDY